MPRATLTRDLAPYSLNDRKEASVPDMVKNLKTMYTEGWLDGARWLLDWAQAKPEHLDYLELEISKVRAQQGMPKELGGHKASLLGPIDGNAPTLGGQKAHP